MKLTVKLIRDIRQSAGQFLSFVLIVAVGAFFYTGLATLSNQLSSYTDVYIQEHRLSDLNVYYGPIPPEEAARFGRLEGVSQVEGRYTFEGTEAFEGYRTSLKIHSLAADHEINTMAMTEGRLPSGPGEMALDVRYARAHEHRVGDSITVRAGDRELSFTVSGLGENVEYMKKNETQDHHNQGFAYVDEQVIPEVAGEFLYNELLVKAEAGYDIDRIGASMEELSQDLPYLGQESKERSFNYSSLKATLHNNRLMSRVIPLVLFLIEAIILYLAMSRIIDSQRNQVGIMKALGVKSSSIMLHYMGYPVLVGIAGSILGYAISAVVFVPFISVSIGRSYSLPDIQFALSLSLLLPPVLISGSFGALACYLSGRKLLKEGAAQAMRPKPPKSMKSIWIERIPGLWKRLPYSYKLILRNIFLNKSKVLASSAGVMVSTVLLITAFGTQASLEKVAGQFEQVYSYDFKIHYKAGHSADSSHLPDGIGSQYGLSAYPIQLHKGNRSEKASLIVTEPQNELIRYYDDQGNALRLTGEGVLVPQSYADHYGIAEGDIVQIVFTAPEYGNRMTEMKVSGISAQYSTPAFYATPAYLAEFGLAYSPDTIVAEAGEAADLADIRSQLEKDQTVDAIYDQEDLRREARYILQQNSFVFIMFIVCAVILSFGAIYTISSINIYERNRELATLKVLGYFKTRINRLIFFENMMVTAFAVLIALPVCGYVYEMVVKALSSTHQQIPDQLNVWVVLVSVLLAFGLTILANLLLRRRVNRIPMIESLKGLE